MPDLAIHAGPSVTPEDGKPSVKGTPPYAESRPAPEDGQPVLLRQPGNLSDRHSERLGDGPDAADDVLDVVEDQMVSG